jgi:hypothetical protein
MNVGQHKPMIALNLGGDAVSYRQCQACHTRNHADQAYPGLGLWVKDHEEELRSTLARKEADQNFEKLDIDMVDPGKCQTDFGWDM